jgi:hypothetical protein
MIYKARVKLRGDSGPSGELSEQRRFVEIDGLYYDVNWIKSVPGLRLDQLAEIDLPEQPKSA